MTFLPSRANQLIFGAVYLGIRKDTESDVDYYVAQKTWPKHQKYHTTHAVYLRLEQLMLMAVQQKRPGAQPPPWDVRTGNFPSPAGSAAASEEGVPAGAAAGPGEASPAAVGFASAGAPAAPGDLAPGGLGDGAAVASAPPPVSMSPALPPPLGTSSMPVPLSEQALHGLAASLRGEPDDDEDEGEETMALAAADAATLALEEAKYRVPLSMMGEAAGAKGDEDEESSAQSTDESESSIDLEEGTPSVESALLAPGVTAEVRGLTQAPRYNGTTCLVLSHDSSSAKWVVRLDDGAKARLPGKALNVPSVVLAPGGQARIHGMIKAEQFNGTLAKLLEWDASAEKWRVKLFTGAKATVAAQNLAPEEGLGFAF